MSSTPIHKADYIVSIVAVWAAFSCSNGRQSQSAAPPPVQDLQPSEIRRQMGFDDIHKGMPSEKKTEGGSGPLGFEERYRFADHIGAAHVRSSGLLIDFGTPSRDKYTLSEWMNGFKGNFDKDGATYSYLTSNTGRIYFYAMEEESGGGTIAFRLKAEGSKKARVYLNDKYIGEVKAGPAFDHSRVVFQTGIRPGLNEIMLKGGSSSRTKEGIQAALAVDYVRVLPNRTDDGPAASSYDTIKGEAGADGKNRILIGPSESATYYLPIPEGGRIVGRVRPEDEKSKARFLATVKTDTKGEVAALDLALSGSTPFDLDLSSKSGEAAEISFSATGGGVIIEEVALFEKSGPRQKAPGAPRAKNVILVLIDTFRSDKYRVLNPNTEVKTDYLSSLTKEAMIFERAFAPENWTKPSTASLLTGLYPETHGTKGDADVLPSEVTMIPEHLKTLGFTTTAFIANGYVSDKFGFKQGWDYWTNYVREGKPNRAQFVMADATAWLDKRTDDKPFFMYVHTIDPHVPYIPPQKYLKLYDPESYDGPVEAAATAKIAEGFKKGSVSLNARDRVRFEALYNGEITYHDDQFVALEDKLKQLNLLNDTAMIITSDHGEEFFDHGSVGHGHSLYEELLHVPFIVRLPGTETTETPARDTEEVSLVDVFPTICDLLGAECPKEIEGKSLVSRLTAKGRDDFPSARVSDFLFSQKAIRMGRYKLIYRGVRTTLFDLKNDPGEKQDLSSEYPIALVTLRDALSVHLAHFADIPGSSAQAEGAKKHKAKKTVIDKETAAQLKALGYLGGE
jgi:arylsulfatase A-like enzyme